MTSGIKKTHNDFIQEVYKLEDNNYSVLGIYKNAQEKILIKHNICGYEWDVQPNSFLQGIRCPICSLERRIKKITKTHEQFCDEVYELENDNYTVLSKYINTHKKILMRHNICGNKYEVTPHCFLQGTRCPKCFGNIKKTHEQFVKEVYNLVNNEYIVIGNYINADTNLLIKHNKCGNEYNVTPNSFLSGQRCPRCSESKGEKRIRCYLKENNILFKPQYTFDDLLSDKGNKLKFDFGVLDNCNIIYLIEYDGIHHYKPVKRFGGEDSLKIVIYHDQLKNNYCENKNIPLLRIPYWDFENIENILTDYLDGFGGVIN